MDYTDFDWGNCPTDRRLQSGFLFKLSICAVSWETKKQKTVTLSTCEAEYMALTECTKETVFLQRFLKELGFEELTNITIYGDNLGAIKLAENPVFHQRSKHIDIKYQYVREALHNENLKIEHISTANMVADMLTKGLPKAWKLSQWSRDISFKSSKRFPSRFERECWNRKCSTFRTLETFSLS